MNTFNKYPDYREVITSFSLLNTDVTLKSDKWDDTDLLDTKVIIGNECLFVIEGSRIEEFKTKLLEIQDEFSI